jgi:tetratricopeptide (TPR) repeat protein
LKRLVSFPDQKKADDSRGRRESAEKWFQRGLECEQTGAVHDAIKAYESAVSLDPTSAGAWLNLGTIFFNARQFSKAETHYRKALEADPKYALAHFNVANLYDERGDYDRALHHYAEAVRLNPTYADAHYNLALLFQGSGKVMEAVRHWKTYLKLYPGSSCASIARRHLQKLRRHTVLSGKRAVGIDRER